MSTPFGGPTGIVEDGVAKLSDRSFFAGSTATTDRCVRTVVHDVGVGLQEAIKLATVNPARFMCLDADRGSLVPGKRADLVVLDDSLTVQNPIVGGQIVFG